MTIYFQVKRRQTYSASPKTWNNFSVTKQSIDNGKLRSATMVDCNVLPRNWQLNGV